MLTSGIPRRRFLILVSAPISIVLLWVYWSSGNILRRTTVATNPLVVSAPLTLVDGEAFNHTAINDLCMETQWVPGLIFTCENSVGGIGNIRNSILACVRFAIEGGGSLIMPKIVVRNESDIGHIRTEVRANMDYMFDVNHFMDAMAISCPQLKLYDNTSSVEHIKAAHEPVPLAPESLVQHAQLLEVGVWRDSFMKWLGDNIDPAPTDLAPAIISLQRSYLEYPIHRDGDAFANNFGKILKFPSSAYHIAAIVLVELSRKHGVPVRLDQPIMKKSYFGLHLRTEADSQTAWPPGDDKWWHLSSYPVQSELFLAHAAKSNLSVVYAASGNLTELAKLKHDGETNYGLTITTKYDLLSGKERKQLEAMTFDQQGLIDFLVLRRASQFAGVGHSSFAWNIALQRRRYSTVSNYLEGPQVLSDELSQVFDKVGTRQEYVNSMWP